MSPKAIITGITGQDGSYLTELLISKGYTVHGIVRQTGILSPPRLAHLIREPDIYGSQLFLHYADLNDAMKIRRIVHQVEPDEFYHLAGQSHVGLSFDIPESTCELTIAEQIGSFLTMMGPRNLVLDCHERLGGRAVKNFSMKNVKIGKHIQ